MQNPEVYIAWDRQKLKFEVVLLVDELELEGAGQFVKPHPQAGLFQAQLSDLIYDPDTGKIIIKTLDFPQE